MLLKRFLINLGVISGAVLDPGRSSEGAGSDSTGLEDCGPELERGARSEQEEKLHVDQLLDETLIASFRASDPPGFVRVRF